MRIIIIVLVEMSSTSSLISLTKRLVGSEWHRVYEVLLNLDGKSTNVSTVHRGSSSRERCLDLAISLRAGGRLKCADSLQRLTTHFSENDPMLRVLAQLARISPSTDRKSTVFPFDETSARHSKSVSRNVFSFNDWNAKLKPNEETSLNVENNDFMLSAARRLLDADRIIRKPISDDTPKSRPGIAQAAPTRARKQMIPFRNVTLSRFGVQCEVKERCHPPRLISLLFYLFSSSHDLRESSRETSMTPSTPSHYNPVQDESEMVKRRQIHFASCVACSKRNTEYIMSSGVDWCPSFSDCCDIEEQAIKRAKFCGDIYERLACFSAAYSRAPGRSLVAVAEFAGNLSDEYQRRVLAVVNANQKASPAICWEVLFAAEKCIEDTIAICEILKRIEITTGSASDILDIISGALREHQNVRIGNKLFYSAFSPYLEMILDWVLYASTAKDSGREFFGTVLGKKITDPEDLASSEHVVESGRRVGMYPLMMSHETALFILRSGRSRALLELLSGNHRLLRLGIVPNLTPLSDEKLVVLSRWLSNSSIVEDSGENSESPTKCVPVETQENYGDGKVPRQIFIADSGVNESPVSVLSQIFRSPRECSSKSTRPKSHGLFRVPEVKEMHPNPPEMIDLHPTPSNLFNDIVIGNLRTVDVAVQQEIFSIFVEKIRVFDHLKLLSDFGLLGAGNFADVLVDQINEAETTTVDNERFITRRVNAAKTFYGSSGGGGSALRKQRHLATSLRNALDSVGRTNFALTENFSISTGSWETKNSSLWNTPFEIEYEASFPLTMIVTAEALELYSKFFNFFLSVHRARKSMRSLYLRTRRPRNMQNATASSSPTTTGMNRDLWIAIWQFSWHADHFVSIVGGYQFNQLHGVARHNFESKCGKITSIWELSELHTTYLSDSIRRVLLGERQQSVMRVITGAFTLIFQIEAEISNAQDKSGNFPRATWTRLMSKLESATNGLKRRSTFLIDVLEKLVATGAHIELCDFLTRLNFNQFYSNNG